MQYRYALGGVIDLIEHQAVQMNVEIGGRAETLDQALHVSASPKSRDHLCRCASRSILLSCIAPCAQLNTISLAHPYLTSAFIRANSFLASNAEPT